METFSAKYVNLHVNVLHDVMKTAGQRRVDRREPGGSPATTKQDVQLAGVLLRDEAQALAARLGVES